MRKLFATVGVLAITATTLFTLSSCGDQKQEEKMSAADEITQMMITGEYDDFENPAGAAEDYETLDEYLAKSFEASAITENSKEALSMISVLAYQNTHNVASNEEIVNASVSYLQDTYPDYLATDKSVEATLYHAYCLMDAYENDKSNQRYTLGTVVAHAIQDYYVGDESKEDAQAFIDQMGTQFFDNLDAKTQTANVAAEETVTTEE